MQETLKANTNLKERIRHDTRTLMSVSFLHFSHLKYQESTILWASSMSECQQMKAALSGYSWHKPQAYANVI